MMEGTEVVQNLYDIVCGQKWTDGEQRARIVAEIESIIGKQFRNTQEFHYHVADYLKRKRVVNETLGGKMRRARKKAGLTQVELAEKLGVDRRTLIRWERNEQTPSQEALKWADSVQNVTFSEGAG